jgi:TPR repeat protein
LGSKFYRGEEGLLQDYKQAATWFRKAAEENHAKSQPYLGTMLKEGQGVIQDYQKASKWYLLAADQGVAEAQLNLGFMYDAGMSIALII